MDQLSSQTAGAEDRPVARVHAIDPSIIAPPKQIAAINAFPTRIEAYIVPNSEELNDALIAEIAQLRSVAEGVTVSNREGWHSTSDFFLWQQPSFITLQAHFMATLTASVRHYWAGFDPESHLVTCEGWVNINGPGGFNVPHDHPGSHLSACYYVTAPKVGDKARESIIEFLQPAGALMPFLAFGRAMTPGSVKIAPEPGQLLVFPSYLKHWVHPNRAAEDRISVAVNATVHAETLEPAKPG